MRTLAFEVERILRGRNVRGLALNEKLEAAVTGESMDCWSDALIESHWPLVSAQPPPRIHVLSDLQLQQGPHHLPDGLAFDVLVAAGNLGPVETAINWLAQVGKPVVYLPARQELLGGADAIERARRLAAGSQVQVLERECIELAGVRFLGVRAAELAGECDPTAIGPDGGPTLEGAGRPPQTAPDAWFVGQTQLVTDRQEIWGQTWVVEAWLRTLQSRPWQRWLRAQLATPFGGPTVVVSDCRPDDMLWRDGGGGGGAGAWLQGGPGQAIDLWIHSGDARLVDELVGQIRVVCNPHLAGPSRCDRPGTTSTWQGHPGLPSLLADRECGTSPRPVHVLGRVATFDARLVLTLHEGSRGPLRRACAPARSRMQQLRAELAQLLPLCARGTTLLDRCVAEAFAARIERLAEIVGQLHEELLAPIDRYWDRGPHSGHPLPPTAELEARWDVDHPPQSEDFVRLLSECDQALAWVEALPGAAARRLRAWREAAKKAVAAGQAAGAQLRVRRLPASALRRLDNHELHLLVMPPATGSDDRGALRQRAYAAVDQALNGNRLPREWRFELREDAQGWDFVEIAELLRPRWFEQGGAPTASPSRPQQNGGVS